MLGRVAVHKLLKVSVYVVFNFILFKVGCHSLEFFGKHTYNVLAIFTHKLDPLHESIEGVLIAIVDSLQSLRKIIWNVVFYDDLELLKSRMKVGIVLNIHLVSLLTEGLMHADRIMDFLFVLDLLQI
jgi:hypothetical protein